MKVKIINNIFIVFFICIVSSCIGYKVCDTGKYSGKTISIPYILGDENGIFTQNLIYELSSLGNFEYTKNYADLNLIIKIINVSSDKIGYRKYRKQNNTLDKSVMASENRLTFKIKAHLEDTLNCKTIWGPKVFEESIDFDYVEQDSIKDLEIINPEGQKQTLLSFSLGQMESINAAKEAAKIPLYNKISRNVILRMITDISDMNIED